MLISFLAVFLICTFSGILTGLLGIGGGLIIIPAFMTFLPLFGIDNFSVSQIIGISATCVFLNSATTLFLRKKEAFLPKNILFKIALAISLGTILGAYIGSFIPDKLIFAVYLMISLVSLFLLNNDLKLEANNKLVKALFYPIFALIGGINAIIGLGGAVFFMIALKCFFSRETKTLLPSVTMLVFVHATFAFISKFLLGEIVPVIIPFALIASVLGSRIGVRISKKLTSKTLNLLLTGVLLIAIAKIFSEFIK